MHIKGNLRDRVEAVRVLSEGLLFQTLLGRDRITGAEVVLKRPLVSSQTPTAQLSLILRDCFEATRFWKHPGVLVPFAGYEHEGMFELAIRHLPDHKRSGLTSDLMRRHGAEILPQLFTAVEFIHLMGNVHCDLTPDNIFVLQADGKARVVISDLDLVRPIGSQPAGRIIGTPPFIAPEVYEDDIIVAQSDYYSLGVILFLLSHRDQSLREKSTGKSTPHDLAGVNEADCDFVEELKWLAQCVAALLTKHYQLRPPALLPLLTKANPQLYPDRKSLERELFRHDLRSSYRRYVSKNRGQNPSPAKFMRSSQRVFGIPDEILSGVAKSLHLRPRRQYRVLKDLVRDSDLGVNGNKWNLRVPLESARAALEYAIAESGIDVQEEVRALSRRQLLRRAVGLEKSGELLSAVFWFERIHENLMQTERITLGLTLQVRIAHLLQRARYFDAATSTYNALLKIPELPLKKRAIVLRGLADAYRFSISREECFRYLGQAYGIQRKLRSDLGRFANFLNMVWRLDSKSRIESAYRRLCRIEAFLQSNSSRTFRLISAHLLGHLEFRMGRPHEAERTTRRALEAFGESNGLTAITVRGNLVTMLTELGRYRESYKEAEKVLRNPLTRRDVRRRVWLYVQMTTIACILGDYESAAQSAGKLLETAQASNDTGAVALHSFELGWFYLRCGRLAEARDSLLLAAHAYSEMDNKISLARTHLFLSLLSSWRGQIDAARSLNSHAVGMFAENPDPIDALDARQIALQIEREEGRKISVAEATGIINDYLERRNCLGAAFTASLLLLEREHSVVESLLKQNVALAAFCRESGAVIGKALLLHLKACRAASKVDENIQLAPMRETLLFYRKYGYFYHAANVAIQLGEQYQDLEKMQLARGFFAEAARLYTVLGNRKRSEAAKSRLASLDQAGNSATAKYRSIFEVSELLNALEDYETTTSKLLTFAVEQTGAERAALLLATEGGADLRIESAIDCDKVSREDILTISRSVIKAVFEKNEALIVTDAQTNSITREYRSVIKHNIYSIACVPLLSGGGILGVLYLDHHSLPSVFSADERKLVEAVANFIGVALSRARQFDLSRRQTHALALRNSVNGAGSSFITRNISLSKLIDRIPQIADSRAAILLLGESGTGKDVLANIIHQHSPYRDGPLVAVNCAGYAGEVLESQLFGIEKGVATGVTRREGIIQSADGGTLFLDEIGDMPVSTQIKLLRVLETKEVQMVGGRQSKRVDFRLVAATNRDLAALIAEERFRSDLYYRINTVEIKLPPLRERIEDIETLIEHFTEDFCPGRKFKFTRSSWKLLNEYHWPGNVREVRNMVERLAIQSNSDVISEDLLPAEIRRESSKKSNVLLRPLIGESEKALIVKILGDCKGNQSEAARRLGIPFSTLQRKIKKFKIKVPRKRR